MAGPIPIAFNKPKGVAPAAPDLQANNVHFWDGDEIDDGNILAQNGAIDGVLQGTFGHTLGAAPDGGTCRSAAATGRFLFANNIDITAAGTIMCWARFNVNADSPIGWDGVNNSYLRNSSATMQANINGVSNNTPGFDRNTFGFGDWFMIVLRWGGVPADEIIAYREDGQVRRQTLSAPPIVDTPAAYHIAGFLSTVQQLDGDICSIGNWDVSLPDTHTTEFFNNGVNYRWANLPGP